MDFQNAKEPDFIRQNAKEPEFIRQETTVESDEVVFGMVSQLPNISEAVEYLKLTDPELAAFWPRGARLDYATPILQKCFEWTHAIQHDFERREVWKRIPRFNSAAFGFALTEPQNDPWVLGAIAFSDDLKFATSRVTVMDEPLDVLGQVFPVVIRHAYRREHGAFGVDPCLGLTTCAAENASNTACYLSAYHVIEDRANPGQVALRPSSSGVGKILDVPTGTVDAGTFEGASAPPNLASLRRFKPRELLCPGELVSFTDQHSNLINTKIVYVSDTRGSLAPQLQFIFYTRHAGMPGDSGALVVDSKNNGIGIYLGEVKSALSGNDEGYVQSLAQVEACLNLSLYM